MFNRGNGFWDTRSRVQVLRFQSSLLGVWVCILFIRCQRCDPLFNVRFKVFITVCARGPFTRLSYFFGGTTTSAYDFGWVRVSHLMRVDISEKLAE